MLAVVDLSLVLVGIGAGYDKEIHKGASGKGQETAEVTDTTIEEAEKS